MRGTMRALAYGRAMNEEQSREWMRELARSGDQPELPALDLPRSRLNLEEQIRRRRTIVAPLAWAQTALQGASGLALMALQAWFGATFA